jgi:UDP-GlcNAc:undecaprenyl-phosphate GlcNAc-1-phosphate transferase
LLALLISLIIVPLVRRQAILAGRVDTPDHRKIHQVPTPRLGGVGIFSGFMLAFILLMLSFWTYPHNNGVSGVLAGGTLIFILGLLDDLYNISPYIKLAGQFLAALVAYYLGVQITALDLPAGKILLLHAFSLPITVLWIMGLANALNFIDGVDGLAGGVTTISAVTLAIVAVFTNQPIAALMASLLAGGCLGFLVYNFFPARIFMGDSGALFCGFMLASIAVTGVLKTKVVVMLLPILVLTVPILDITYSTLRRLFLLKNPFIADADHIHHKLLKAGFSQTWVVWSMYLVSLVAGIIATDYVRDVWTYLGLMLGLVLLAVFLIVLIRKVFPKLFFRNARPGPGSNLPADPHS